MRIFYSAVFSKDLSRLLKRDRKYSKKVEKVITFMEFDIRHPSLRLHKLSAMEFYSISVDMKIRIILKMNKDELFLLRIGTHDEVY